MSVILNKIDGKLINGKVTNSFGRLLVADEYILVNDEVVNDEEKIDLMQLLIPAGSQFDVVSCKTYANIYKENDYYGKKTIVVFRTLDDVMTCLGLGVKFEQINCAGSYSSNKGSAVEYEKALTLAKEDIENLMTLHNQGVELIYQPTFHDKVVSVSQLLGFKLKTSD